MLTEADRAAIDLLVVGTEQIVACQTGTSVRVSRGFNGTTAAAHGFGATRHMHLYGTTRDHFGEILLGQLSRTRVCHEAPQTSNALRQRSVRPTTFPAGYGSSVVSTLSGSSPSQ